jgi:hypothetical protein
MGINMQRDAEDCCSTSLSIIASEQPMANKIRAEVHMQVSAPDTGTDFRSSLPPKQQLLLVAGSMSPSGVLREKNASKLARA